MTTDTDLCQLGITQVAPLLRQRRLSPVELADAYLDRIQRLDPALNAHILVMPEQARAAARQAEAEIGAGQYRGPLHGVPLGIKDLLDVAGAPTTMGSEILRDNVAVQDASVVSRLRSAGGVILGKHNLHEFAFGVTSENPHYGPVHNPWALDHVPGGSSGGTAAAVAAGLCAAGLGSDTGASIRAPASWCGTVGLKPTYGRVSRAGALPLAWSLDHLGPLARSVADCAIVLQSIAGHDPRDPASSQAPVPDFSAGLESGVRGLRLGVPRDHFFEVVEPEVERLVRSAIATLEGLGARVVEVPLPHCAHAQAVGNVIMSSEAASWHADWLRDRAGDYGADVLARVRGGLLIRASEYLAAQQMRTLIQQDFVRAFEQADVVLGPTVPLVAPPIGRTQERGGALNLVPRSIANRTTVPCNLTGTPALSLPCGLVDGLPVGLQIMGAAFSEALVLRVAAAYESATAWHTLRPPRLAELAH
ncbi:MAG: aspartyl/glutamyl-tRNA amidotransferase subunit A [Acetobacteraceae bacterium]|nr:aspartyl/glutamyl-tRNA amidotransferase subunit A [Acetobacteraceae bacterium]